MKHMQMIWFLCAILLHAHPTYGEANVWFQAQKAVDHKYVKRQNNTQNLSKQTSRYELPSYPDSLSSPYFYYQYAPDFRSARVPLTLSDQELFIFFVGEPSINVNSTLKTEELFFWVPDNFKCRFLIPVGAVLRASNNPDSLYAPYDSCLANLPQPLLRSEQPTYTLTSNLSDEDVQQFLTLHRAHPWRIYRKFKSSDDEVLKQVERLRQNPDVGKVWEMFYMPNPAGKIYPLVPLDKVVVLFRENVSQPQAHALSVQYGTEIIENTNGIFELKINAGGGIAALKVTELFRQTPQVLLAEPFLFTSEPGIEFTPDIYDIFISEGSFRIDFNKSGTPDLQDFILFASGFGSQMGEETFDARFDLNDDDQITFPDFLLFVQAYQSGQ